MTTVSEDIIANLVTSKLSGEYSELVGELIRLVKTHPTARKITVSFSGGGDSGDINDIIYDPELPDGSDFEFDDKPFYELLEREVSCDWVNNDGGGGEMTINLTTAEIHLTSYYHETVTTDCDDKFLSLI